MRNSLVFILFLFSIPCFGQSPVFVQTINSSVGDETYGIEVAANGDLLVCGRFGGMVDFDFSTSVFNLTSNGSTDIFVARYTATGSFIWAFKIGGSDLDGAYEVKEDNDGNIVVAGYFRQNNIDFDPGVGVSLLSSNGQSGTNVGFGGDAFLAKYTATGNYIWAFSVGGLYSQEGFNAIDIDINNNIYVGGFMNPTGGVIDFDPGAGVFNLGGIPNGHAVLAKYLSNGSFVWAFSLGDYGKSAILQELELDPNDTTLVVTGHFIGTNADFDPGPGVTNLNTGGFSDMFLAKYSINGNYMWAHNYGGTVTSNFQDYGFTVAVDNSSNIYFAGTYSGNNVDFDPSSGSTLLSSNGGVDIVYGMYLSNGQLGWVKGVGGIGNETRAMLSLSNNEMILSGVFPNSCDFDPGPGVANFTSNGGLDIFLGKYDLQGNYKCGYSVGGSTDDYVLQLHPSTSLGNTLAVGLYNSNPIDFDPDIPVLNKTNTGSTDGFFGEFTFSCASDTIINHYAAVQSYDSCTNSILVDNAVGFKNGDTILMIQMKGATIDTSNTVAFGNIVNYENAGNYEENIIQNITGNTITLKNTLLRTYSIPNGKVQVVSIPQFSNYTITKQHTAAAWDGNKGGVFALNVTGTLTMNKDINVNGKGFRGGTVSNSSIVNCNKTDYYYPATQNEGGQKGESISTISNAKLYGRGKLASGGGGGNSHNAGGGGGSNAGSGGQGGNQYNWNGCTSPYVPVIGGLGGISLAYNNTNNKIFLGGGGGCGHANNQGGNNGGNGGGLVYLKANNVVCNVAAVVAKGENASYAAVVSLGVNDDGGNGGGSGGTILMKYNSLTSTLTVNTNGGNGSDAHTANTPAGPGGGGGGGVLWVNQTSIPTTISYSTLGGLNGVVPEVGNTPFNSQPGQAGQSITALQMPISNSPFQGFNSVNAGNDTAICLGQSAQLNATGALTYVWSPATTLTNAGIANPIATPTVSTSYIVTGTDNKGCTDRDTMNVIVSPGISINVAATRDTVCPGQPVTLTASGASTYSWTGGLTNGVPFTPTTTRTYVVTGTDAGGCIGTTSYTIIVRDIKVIITPSDPLICRGDTIILQATGATNYLWSPGVSLAMPLQSSTKAFPNGTTTYTVVGTDANNCKGTATVTVDVISEIDLEVSKSGDINCNPYPVQLAAKGGYDYLWSPGKFLNDSTSANPKATITKTTTFTVTSSLGSCFGTADITVYYFNSSESGLFVPNAFTPNNDGLNDCYHVISQGNYDTYELHIYNRWGQEMWDANSTNSCWDGTFGGEPVPVGTYYYWLKAKGECGDVLKKGDIIVIR